MSEKLIQPLPTLPAVHPLFHWPGWKFPPPSQEKNNVGAEMVHSVCIYRDKRAATAAAAAVRRRGVPAILQVDSLQDAREFEPIFILKSRPEFRQKVIDSVAEESVLHPELSSNVLRCPNCSSIDLQYEAQVSLSIPFRNLKLVLDRIIRFLGCEMDHVFTCRRCGNVWKENRARNRAVLSCSAG